MKFSKKIQDMKNKVEQIKSKKKKNSVKENVNFRKKVLKVLKSKDKYVSEGESEEGNITDILDENFEKYNHLNGDSKLECVSKDIKDRDRESKKTKIKNKETLNQENEMLQVISSIISSEPSVLLRRAMDVVVVDKVGRKKNKSNNEVPVENNVKKIELKEKKKRKNHESTSKDCPALNFDSYNFKQSKINSKVDYKKSVIEIFGSGKSKSAVVKSADLKLHHNNDRGHGSKDTASQECHLVTKQTHINDDDVMDISEAVDKVSDSYVEYGGTPDESKNFNLYTFSKCCVLILKQNTKLYFCGKLKATLLRGNVDILGHKMDSTTQDIYSLPILSLMYFQSHQHKDKMLNISRLLACDISEYESKMILSNIGSSDSVLLLKPLNNKMVEFVTKHYKNFNVFVKKVDTLDNNEAFNLLQCHFFTGSRKGLLELNPKSSVISDSILHRLNTPSKNITMICGGKNSGKSTFLRYIVNSCVAKTPVLVLDFDPGQPEFTVCGLLSATVVSKPLLGPNFTHLTQPDRSLVLGFLNISENENRYMACVQDLYKYCLAHGKYANMPWIINTCGFTGSIGMRLIAFIMNVVQPTTVIELKSNIRRNNFETNLKSFNVNEYQRNIEFVVNDSVINKVSHSYDYHCLESYYYQWTSNNPSMGKNIEPKDERLLNLLAYFSGISNTNLSILGETPYAISLDDITLALNNCCVDMNYMYSIINGKLVALCHDDNVEDSNKTVVDIDLFTCYGFGIVRGIDLQQRKIFITTPVKPSLVSFVNTLAYGETFPDCIAMSVDCLPEGVRVPYMMSYVDSTINKQLMKTPKRKFNPFRLLEINNH